MRELVLKMSMSIDGFVAGDRAESNWMFRGSTPDSAGWVYDIIASAGIHAIGRGLFETWVNFYPTSPIPVAGPVNSKPKIVFTRNPSYVPGAGIAPEADPDVAATYTDARIASGELVTEIERLKSEPGDYILAQGGVEFARSLVKAGLVDEFRLAVLPMLLGSGQSIFTGLEDELDLELVSSTAFTGGALGLVYRPRK
jgi:dihydrofolate reductase